MSPNESFSALFLSLFFFVACLVIFRPFLLVFEKSVNNILSLSWCEQLFRWLGLGISPSLYPEYRLAI